MPSLSNRARRRVVARLLEAPRRAEARYVRELRGLARAIHEQTVSWLNSRNDASIPEGFDAMTERLIDGLRVRVAEAFDRTASTLSTANRKSLRAVGVRPHTDIRLGTELERRRAENIDLVVKASRAYAQGVKDIFSAPENSGLRVEELKGKLLERADVSESRAELIARDQTLKLNGAITQIRQENAGIQEYVWSTSLDERVRSEHRALEGERFSWHSPPSVGHPGQDYQCRCVAIPVIPELESV